MPQSTPGRFHHFLVYAVLVAAAIGGFLVIRLIGEDLFHASEDLASPTVGAQQTHSVNVIFHVLATLTAVIGLGNFLGRILQRIGQPPVIGEVIAGICLGPSLLGQFSPELMHLLIPDSQVDPYGRVAASLHVIAQLGVILYMFLVGLSLDSDQLKHHVQSSVAISHASIVAPFLLGSTLAIWLYARYAPSGVAFTSFSLFIGVAMSITAFPVLARILSDRGLESTPLGTIALTCAAADDATAWCLLAIIMGIIQGDMQSAAMVTSMTAGFLVLMFWGVRPLLARWSRSHERDANSSASFPVPLAIVAVFLAAMTTELIGIHVIFGAFLLGAAIPSESRFAADFRIRLKEATTTLLLPAFFAYTGMRTQIGLISGWENWMFCLAIILIATLGKFGGTLLAARMTGICWREAAALGTLMNTRGLMELIVLNIGLDLGVISPTLFAMMVLMALVTTAATSPILARLLPQSGALFTPQPPQPSHRLN